MARRRMQPRFFLFLFSVVGIGIGIFLLVRAIVSPAREAAAENTPLPSSSPTVPAEATPKPPLPDNISVVGSEAAAPERLGFSTVLQVNGGDTNSYTRSNPVSFGRDEDYTDVPGLLTFGGNNYRNTFAYGTTVVSERRLYRAWEERIGQIDSWTGTGWTGQPLIVQWPDEVRPVLGVSETYKTKEGFVEVIYPAMDGYIYFYDLESGARTRDPINVGVVMKGTACLDPNGYPLLYVGQGIPVENENGLSVAYIRVYSLITNEEIHRFGGYDYFGERGWQAYDGSPLISNDTLFYAGENGVLYSSKLNTQFDAAAGTVSINPERLVKYRYEGAGYSKSDAANSRWYGVESSVAAFRNYLYFTDNGGRLQCVDANTYNLLFVTDVGEDADATVVIEESYDDGTIYLYTASQANTSVGELGEGFGYSWHKKINGLTGEVVWQKQWAASTGDASNNGGTLATPHVGRGNISNLVIYAMDLAVMTSEPAVDDVVDPEAPTGTGGNSLGGRIVAYDKTTGEVAWSIEDAGAGDYWSSPVVVYDENDSAYLIQCDRAGMVKLYDASTSALLYSLDLGSRIDSTPAVFNNYLVVGTRGKGGSQESAKIICVKIA